MNNIFLILSAVILLSPLSSLEAQNYFSLVRLLEFTQKKSLGEFDKKIRTFGYNYDSTDKSEDYTTYSYFKKYKISSNTYTNSISYSDYRDGRPVIRFSTAFEGYYTYIQNQITSNGFKETGFDSEDGTLIFHYESNSYTLHLYSRVKKMEYSDDKYNTITVKVWKKLND